MIKPVVNKKILIVEDDADYADTVAEYFIKKGNMVVWAETFAEAVDSLSKQNFDAVILDLILPDSDGIELFNLNIALPPVVILSSISSEYSIIDGLSAGALDYVVKPASLELLETRLSLRLLPSDEEKITLHGLTANAVNRTVYYLNKPVPLTGSEFNILWFLMNHAGQFYDAASLYEKIWKMPSLKSNSIKYHISNLRRKLKDAAQKDLIVTEFGKGYKFIAAETDE